MPPLRDAYVRHAVLEGDLQLEIKRVLLGVPPLLDSTGASFVYSEVYQFFGHLTAVTSFWKALVR